MSRHTNCSGETQCFLKLDAVSVKKTLLFEIIIQSRKCAVLVSPRRQGKAAASLRQRNSPVTVQLSYLHRTVSSEQTAALRYCTVVFRWGEEKSARRHRVLRPHHTCSVCSSASPANTVLENFVRGTMIGATHHTEWLAVFSQFIEVYDTKSPVTTCLWQAKFAETLIWRPLQW